MHKSLMIAGAVLCLSAAACSSNDYPRANNNADNSPSYNGYYDESGNDNFHRNDATEDYSARIEENTHYWFDKLDHGHKGYITMVDMRNHAERAFRKMDANHDGKVTYEEFAAYKEMELQRKHERKARMQQENNNQ